MLSFKPNQFVTRGDLDVFLESGGNPAQAAEIFYSLHFVEPGPPEAEVLVGPAQRTPVNPQVGEYYAAFQVPVAAALGKYRIRWQLRRAVNQPLRQVVQEFEILDPDTVTSITRTPVQTGLIQKLRMLLRDQNPDRYYRFRPPEYTQASNSQNRVFGQIWEDAELYEYLQRATDWFNMFPPATGWSLETIDLQYPAWRTALMWQAITHACFALQANWVADEFDYNIGGVSLTLEKSSKYEGLRSAAEQQFDKAIEAKMTTLKYTRGLAQPRMGLGMRSAFGPSLARGTLSPKAFM